MKELIVARLALRVGGMGSALTIDTLSGGLKRTALGLEWQMSLAEIKIEIEQLSVPLG